MFSIFATSKNETNQAGYLNLKDVIIQNGLKGSYRESNADALQLFNKMIQDHNFRTTNINEIFENNKYSLVQKQGRLHDYLRVETSHFLVTENPLFTRSVCLLSQTTFNKAIESIEFFSVFKVLKQAHETEVNIAIYFEKFPTNPWLEINVKVQNADECSLILSHYLYRLVSLQYEAVENAHNYLANLFLQIRDDHNNSYFLGYRGQRIDGLHRNEMASVPAKAIPIHDIPFFTTFIQAQEFFNDDQIEDASHAFKKILTQYPHHRDASICFAEAQSFKKGIELFWKSAQQVGEQQQDLINEAFDHFERVLKINANNEQALFYLAKCYFALDLKLCATFTFNRLSKMQGKLQIAALLNEGIILFDQGENRQAAEKFVTLLQRCAPKETKHQTHRMLAQEYLNKINKRAGTSFSVDSSDPLSSIIDEKIHDEIITPQQPIPPYTAKLNETIQCMSGISDGKKQNLAPSPLVCSTVVGNNLYGFFSPNEIAQAPKQMMVEKQQDTELDASFGKV